MDIEVFYKRHSEDKCHYTNKVLGSMDCYRFCTHYRGAIGVGGIECSYKRDMGIDKEREENLEQKQYEDNYDEIYGSAKGACGEPHLMLP